MVTHPLSSHGAISGATKGRMMGRSENGRLGVVPVDSGQHPVPNRQGTLKHPSSEWEVKKRRSRTLEVSR